MSTLIPRVQKLIEDTEKKFHREVDPLIDAHVLTHPPTHPPTHLSSRHPHVYPHSPRQETDR